MSMMAWSSWANASSYDCRIAASMRLTSSGSDSITSLRAMMVCEYPTKPKSAMSRKETSAPPSSAAAVAEARLLPW
jgi:hypothetical protein